MSAGIGSCNGTTRSTAVDLRVGGFLALCAQISLAFEAVQSDESWCMKHAPTQNTNSFAVPLTDETYLGLAILIP